MIMILCLILEDVPPSAANNQDTTTHPWKGAFHPQPYSRLMKKVNKKVTKKAKESVHRRSIGPTLAGA
jgi:hypothetical protein